MSHLAMTFEQYRNNSPFLGGGNDTSRRNSRAARNGTIFRKNRLEKQDTEAELKQRLLRRSMSTNVEYLIRKDGGETIRMITELGKLGAFSFSF